MQNLKTANFDPEFYRLYEEEIINAFNTKTNLNIQLKPKSWWRNLITN